MSQKIFKTSVIEHLVSRLKAGDLSIYYSNKFEPNENSILIREDINNTEDIKLKKPNIFGKHAYDNAVAFYTAYRHLTPEQAADGRFWTFLTHVVHRDYMVKKRLPKTSDTEEKKINQILQHWFVYPLNAKNILRNDIALMWWGVYLTFDEKRKDPFELTKELFSMADYTRTLLPSVQGRNNIFTHALLEFVIENPKLFESQKEAKIRFLMRKSNFLGGYKILSVLSKTEIKNIFKQQELTLKDEECFRDGSPLAELDSVVMSS
jgi:hypothetical protein